jgi:hypothetical protein
VNFATASHKSSEAFWNKLHILFYADVSIYWMPEIAKLLGAAIFVVDKLT